MTAQFQKKKKKEDDSDGFDFRWLQRKMLQWTADGVARRDSFQLMTLTTARERLAASSLLLALPVPPLYLGFTYRSVLPFPYLPRVTRTYQ
jgi:hypothetical protein